MSYFTFFQFGLSDSVVLWSVVTPLRLPRQQPRLPPPKAVLAPPYLQLLSQRPAQLTREQPPSLQPRLHPCDVLLQRRPPQPQPTCVQPLIWLLLPRHALSRQVLPLQYAQLQQPPPFSPSLPTRLFQLPLAQPVQLLKLIVKLLRPALPLPLVILFLRLLLQVRLLRPFHEQFVRERESWWLEVALLSLRRWCQLAHCPFMLLHFQYSCLKPTTFRSSFPSTDQVKSIKEARVRPLNSANKSQSN